MELKAMKNANTGTCIRYLESNFISIIKNRKLEITRDNKRNIILGRTEWTFHNYSTLNSSRNLKVLEKTIRQYSLWDRREVKVGSTYIMTCTNIKTVNME